MAKILNLPPEAYMYARLQGRAMQYINFIRDVEEDRQLGRVYLPLADSGITSLEHRHALIERDAFTDFIHVQIGRYRQWQAEAKKGFRYIPVRYLIPIKTASDMYSWTARKIELDPFIIYYTKVKPRRSQVRLHAFSNAIRIRRIKKRSYRDSLYLLE